MLVGGLLAELYTRRLQEEQLQTGLYDMEPGRETTRVLTYFENKNYLKAGQPESLFGRFAIYISSDILPLFVVIKFAKIFYCNYWIAAILVSIVPGVLILAEYVFSRRGSHITIIWALYYMVVNFITLCFPYMVWTKLIKIADHIDGLFNIANRHYVITQMRRDVNLPKQSAVFVGGGVASVSFLYYSSLTLSQFVPFMATNYLHIFIVGGLANTLLYWLWIASKWHNHIYKINDLNLLFVNPIETPGIRELANLVSYMILLASIGALAIEFPIFFYLVELPKTSWVYYVIVIGLSILAISFILLIGIRPHWLLTKIVKREKQHILYELGLNINTYKSLIFDSTRANREPVFTMATLYHYIAATKSSTFTVGNSLRYVPTMLGALAPLLKLYEFIFD